jgi:hypothetical protein
MGMNESILMLNAVHFRLAQPKPLWGRLHPMHLEYHCLDTCEVACIVWASDRKNLRQEDLCGESFEAHPTLCRSPAGSGILLRNYATFADRSSRGNPDHEDLIDRSAVVIMIRWIDMRSGDVVAAARETRRADALPLA